MQLCSMTAAIFSKKLSKKKLPSKVAKAHIARNLISISKIGLFTIVFHSNLKIEAKPPRKNCFSI